MTSKRKLNPYLLGAALGLVSMGIAIPLGYAWGDHNEPDPVRAPQTTQTTVKAVTFASCAEAKAAGYHDMARGTPGYSSKLDADGDGIACVS